VINLFFTSICSALVKKPKVLILDEATSALDNESEAIVQAAIDRLMTSRSHTVIMIAHRLSTVRNADKIAYIGQGHVLEYGSHDELIEKEHGLYKRLFASSKQKATLDSVGLRTKKDTDEKEEEDEEEEEIDWEAQIAEEEEKAFDAKRARNMATVDAWYLMVGAIGAVMAGGVFPMWGLLFAETIDLLFRRVEACPGGDGAIPDGFDSCEDYWKFTAEDIQDGSFVVAGYWVIVMAGCLCGNIFSFWGFGNASERLNKRLRDSSFTALLRQEVGYFDKRSVGSLTSQLQEDAARIHSFSGEPVRAFLTAMASVVTGITLSFVVSFFVTKQGCFPVVG
jgi:ATP-binding cassette subfamily B (MDR/TAP) protein 1